MVSWYEPYKKFAVAIIGALVLAGFQFFDDNLITNLEWIQILIAGVGAALVYITMNGPIGTFWRYAKTTAYTLSAVLGTLLTVLPDGMSPNDWYSLVIVGLTALGILGARNTPEPHVREVV